MSMIELPVDWFDSPEPSDPITNNDLDPTPLDPGDYAPFWDIEREWIEPHPDMEGYRCSTGWHHVAYQKPPVPPMLDNADSDGDTIEPNRIHLQGSEPNDQSPTPPR